MVSTPALRCSVRGGISYRFSPVHRCVRAIFPARTYRLGSFSVVYNASNNEMVRTKTLVKNAIIQIDATPFKHWYVASHCSRYCPPFEPREATASFDVALASRQRAWNAFGLLWTPSHHAGPVPVVLLSGLVGMLTLCWGPF